MKSWIFLRYISTRIYQKVPSIVITYVIQWILTSSPNSCWFPEINTKINNFNVEDIFENAMARLRKEFLSFTVHIAIDSGLQVCFIEKKSSWGFKMTKVIFNAQYTNKTVMRIGGLILNSTKFFPLFESADVLTLTKFFPLAY